jgi:hypothetical protein
VRVLTGLVHRLDRAVDANQLDLGLTGRASPGLTGRARWRADRPPATRADRPRAVSG